MSDSKSTERLMISLPKMSSFRLSPGKIREFMQLIQERATTNPLYSLADTAQAITAIQSMSILNSLYDTLSDEGMSGDMDDINKLVTLIVKANTSVNSTFKQLSISSDNREEEVDTDPLSRMLRELNLDDYTPPMLKAHFIKAKKDIKAIETGEIVGDMQTIEEKQQMLDDIKKPIKSWVETPTDSEKEDVVDIEEQGVGGL